MGSFSNVWDPTSPPDTQPARLLGQDLRQLKTDIAERMSLLSGPTADRPLMEVFFGNLSDGWLFYSTDENILYRWNGSSWDAVRDMNEYKTLGASQVSATPTIVPIWLSPVDCLISAFKAIRVGGTGATVNADNNGSLIMAVDLSLTTAGAWMDGGALQNVRVTANHPLSLHFNSFSGAPTYVGIQLNIIR